MQLCQRLLFDLQVTIIDYIKYMFIYYDGHVKRYFRTIFQFPVQPRSKNNILRNWDFQPHGDLPISVTYTPADETADTECLQITGTDMVANLINLTLQRTGIMPPLELDITELSYRKSCILGGPTVEFTVEVKNIGIKDAAGTANLQGVRSGASIYSSTIAL